VNAVTRSLVQSHYSKTAFAACKQLKPESERRATASYLQEWRGTMKLKIAFAFALIASITPALALAQNQAPSAHQHDSSFHDRSPQIHSHAPQPHH
jgi:hypothetical protein